jgi:hypothetical protein
MALSCSFAQFLQCILELIQLLAQLHKVLIYRICFLAAFLSGAEMGFLLSIFLMSTTIPGIVHGVPTPMLLAQVAMLLKTDFLGNPGRRLGTRMLFPYIAFVRSFLGRFRLGLLVGTDAFNCFKKREKQTQVNWCHTLLIEIVMVLSLDRAHTQHMAP